MEVTKENFSDAYSAFMEHLPRAAFVSFDNEMTGIQIGPATAYNVGMYAYFLHRLWLSVSMLLVLICHYLVM